MVNVVGNKNILANLMASITANSRIIMVSNRGPVEFQVGKDGHLQARKGSGAVVTAFTQLLQEFELSWVANAMGDGDRTASNVFGSKAIPSPLLNQKGQVKFVVTPRRTYHKFYNIVCNPLLWFLQHNMWSAPYTPNIDSTVSDAWSNGYVPVNEAIAESVLSEIRQDAKGSIVIVQDYHMYLVSGLIRAGSPDSFIYHYVHIPWPDVRSWQLIPKFMRESIFKSLCSNDLVGLQSQRDVYNFLDSCRSFLHDAVIDYENESVTTDGQVTFVKAYPLSINLIEVKNIAKSPRVDDFSGRISEYLRDHTIVRVDRTEPNKNITRGFRAYGKMLEHHPDLREMVVFLAFLVPSRTNVKQYERYQNEINNIVDSINKTYGNREWKPIRVFSENNYAQAIASLRIYDTLLVNPIVDGANLVTKEGPVVNERSGVVILSETSGAFDELKDCVLPVSPADIDGTEQALYQSITMSLKERKERSKLLLEIIEKNDTEAWLMAQFADIKSIYGK
jgi:trehalose 6-phosphate synthase